MTREKIIDALLNSGKISDNQLKFDLFTGDIAKLADELLALIEQEKREQTREILQDLKEYIAYETKPFIKWGSDNPKDEIPAACIDSDMLNNKIDEIAKEYGVKL